MKRFSFIGMLLFSMALTLVLVSCKAPATQLHSGSEFSNIRAELFLIDGTTQTGYTSLNLHSGDDHLTFVEPGKKSQKQIPLSKVEKLKMEDHEFVIRMVTTPQPALRDGKAKQTRAVLKRLSMEGDLLQVFEYKYKVRNPKSPIQNTLTAWFVSFPGEGSGQPLCELGSSCYNQKWASLSGNPAIGFEASSHPPQSVKSLLEQVKNFEARKSDQDMGIK